MASGSKGSGKKGRDKDASRLVQISKALTSILRHTAVDLGLNIRSDGYVSFEEILSCSTVRKLSATLQELERITEESDKKRFEIMRCDETSYIRAVQGHSMKEVHEEDLITPITKEDGNFPEVCVHGTYRRHLPSILRQGLVAGGKNGQTWRNHVHFGSREPGDERIISGMRYNCEVAIWVDLPKAVDNGIPFFVSKNEVVLTPGIDGRVPPRFFIKALDVRTGECLYPTAPKLQAMQEALATREIGTAVTYYSLRRSAQRSDVVP